MRWTPVLILLLLSVPAAAGDVAVDSQVAAGLAVEAQLKRGDLKRKLGDLDGAIAEYRQAVAIYEQALERVAAKQAARADEARVEKLAIARLAFQARLRIAGLLEARGELQESLRVSREAVESFRAAFDALAGEPAAKAEDVNNVVIGIGGGAGGARREIRAGGGPGLADNAVELGLKWLAGHQDVDVDGRWDADGFFKHDPADDQTAGAGAAFFDVGVTSLALLSFLGAGYTDRGAAQQNTYARTVRMGLRYLMTTQDEEGCFGPRKSQQFLYNHAMATLALSEVYQMTRNPRYKRAAQRGLDFIAKSRNPGLAWRYGVRPGDNDTSVTAWCVLALKSGEVAGLAVDRDAYQGALRWLDLVTDKESGRVRYNRRAGAGVARPEALAEAFPAEKSEAMTAAGIFTRILCGQDPRTNLLVAKGADLCVKLPPVWDNDGSIDKYYWYWGTLALFQVGGKHWRIWNKAMKEAIVKNQHPKGSGARRGSWDPVGPWGRAYGGRVYSTALMTSVLEVYYRYRNALGVPR